LKLLKQRASRLLIKLENNPRWRTFVAHWRLPGLIDPPSSIPAQATGRRFDAYMPWIDCDMPKNTP